jgi:DNA-binding CsgD family transcriptional regulator
MGGRSTVARGHAKGHVPGATERITERQTQVWELAAKGLSQRRIAARLDVCVGTVNKDLRRAREFWTELSVQTADEYRLLENERLENALEEAVSILEMTDGDETKLKAIDRIVRLSERRAKLNGLDAPEVVHQVTTEATPEQAAAAVREHFATAETHEEPSAPEPDGGNPDG